MTRISRIKPDENPVPGGFALSALIRVIRGQIKDVDAMSLLHEPISGDIIGAAMSVLNELKPGLDEKIYENALLLELQARHHAMDQQCPFPVHYRNQLVGTLIPDLIVDGKIIVDTKVVTIFTDSHIAQMTGYLAITGLELGLLLNFKHGTLQWKRIVREQPS